MKDKNTCDVCDGCQRTDALDYQSLVALLDASKKKREASVDSLMHMIKCCKYEDNDQKSSSCSSKCSECDDLNGSDSDCCSNASSSDSDDLETSCTTDDKCSNSGISCNSTFDSQLGATPSRSCSSEREGLDNAALALCNLRQMKCYTDGVLKNCVTQLRRISNDIEHLQNELFKLLHEETETEVKPQDTKCRRKIVPLKRESCCKRSKPPPRGVTCPVCSVLGKNECDLKKNEEPASQTCCKRKGESCFNLEKYLSQNKKKCNTNVGDCDKCCKRTERNAGHICN